MGRQTRIEKIIYWFIELFSRYDCAKNRHKWCYELSESGLVYQNDEDVPSELWHCQECGIKKFDQ